MDGGNRLLPLERFLEGHAAFEPKPLYPPGTIIGDWKVLAFLGRGGSGEVYRAENALLGVVGALKTLARDDAKAKVRFRLEARLLSAARCAAFPRFFAYGEAGGRPYVVTELLEPMELPSTDREVAQFLEKVCVGVAELHRLGYIHRDIKPSNIMRRPSTGEPVLIDLGLVKPSDETPLGLNSTTSVVDGHATGVGTPGYSAPEQFSGGRVAPTADIHALGMLVNACFSGNPPRAWLRIVRCSTSSIPKQRYATVDQLVKAIRCRHRGKKLAIAVPLVSVAILGALFSMAKTDIKVADTNGSGNRKAKSLLEMRIPHDEMRKVFQDTSAEAINTNVLSVAWNDIGERTTTNGTTIAKIWLDGKTYRIAEPVKLSGNYKVYIVGPGLLDVDISGAKGVAVHLARNATVLNRTHMDYPESGIMYNLRGESYLNFVNLKMPQDKYLHNVIAWSMDEIVRFGGPLSYREVKESQFRSMMEAEKTIKERQRKSHNLRDVGISDELSGF